MKVIQVPETVLLVAFLVIMLIVQIWNHQTLQGGKVSADELEDYIARMEVQLDLPEPDKGRLIARVKAWASQDNGKPIYMVNLMRYFEEVKPHRTINPNFAISPAASNQHYEGKTMPLVLGRGSYPLFVGEAFDTSLTPIPDQIDQWNRFIVMRYANRRAFLELLAHPDYGQIAAYKTMALDIALIPVNPEIKPANPTTLVFLTGLILILAFGWFRSVQRQKSDNSPTEQTP